MLLLLSLPILLNTHYILQLWLHNVPEHTTLFVQLILLFSMSESISNPLITAQHASGKIRDYQLIVGGLQMVNLPVSYVLLRIGLFPEIVLVVAIFISQCCLAARLILLRKMIGLSIRRYLGKVYLNVVAVSVVAALVPMALVSKLDETLPGFICISLSSIVSCAALIHI